MPLFSRLCALRRESSAVGEYPAPLSLHPPPSPPPLQLEAKSPLVPDVDDGCPSQLYARLAHECVSSLPLPYRWLDPEDVKLVGEHPIAAGGFANVYEATHDSRKVMLKSYRPYISFNVSQVVERFHNEVRVCSILHHGDVGVAPLVGVYSTEAHPFGLVYEFMEGLDFRQYLKNEPRVERLQLQQLTGIARCLNRMHGLRIVHGNLQTTNILIDGGGAAWVAGLGNTSIAKTVPDGRASVGRLSRGHAPELTWPGGSQNMIDPTQPTKAGDIYSFGIMAWEVFTGRPPFYEMTEVAATYSMLSGARPSRQNHHKIPDRVWYMIERCWHNVPSERMSVEEVVNLLETELRRTSASRAYPVPNGGPIQTY